jgi:hypothetical protein
MWWGAAIEAPDPHALARFYSELLGWPIGHEEPGMAILAVPPVATYIVFQQSTNYLAPVWPTMDGQQRPMRHLDFQVGDRGTPGPCRYGWAESVWRCQGAMA